MDSAPGTHGRRRASPDAVVRVVSPVLVGREHERAVLIDTVTAAPAALLIEGEAGIGKSRLVAELADATELAGELVLIGRCHRLGEPFPFGAVVQALRGLRGSVPTSRLSSAVGVLGELVPELADELPPPPPPPDDVHAQRHRVFRAVVELLVATGPVVLVVEDLHWVDAHTIDLLAYVIAEAPEGVALVLTVRSDEMPDEVRDLMARVPSATRAARIALGGLDPDGVASMTRSILDVDEVSAEFATYLHERTAGLPFAVEETLALLRTQRALVRHGGEWSRQRLSELGVPGPVRDSVLARVTSLAPEVRSVVHAAAVVSEAAPAAVLAAVAEVDPVVVDDAVAAGLLEHRDGGIEFRHTLAVDAVEDDLAPERRRELHARAADVLASRPAPPLSRVANHLRLAGRRDEWRNAALAAAEQAAARGHDTEAARLQMALLRDGELDPAATADVARQLGQSALHALAHHEAEATLRAVIETGDLPSSVRGDLRQQLGMLRYQAGDRMGCYAQLEIAVTELDDDPGPRVRAMSRLANVLVPGIDIGRNEEWADRSLAEVDVVDDPLERVGILGNVLTLQVTVGDRRWPQLAASVAAEADSLGDDREVARQAHNLASAATFIGCYEDARAAVARGMAVADGDRDLRGHLCMRTADVVLDLHLGRWETLAERVHPLLAEVSGLTGQLVEVQFTAGCLALATGDLDQARALLAGAHRRAEDQVWLQVLSPIAAALARVHQASGSPQDAIAIAIAAAELIGGTGLWTAAGPAVVAATGGLIDSGRHEDARDLVARFDAGIRNRIAPAAHAALSTCQGLLAAATHDRTAAVRAHLVAADAYARMANRYEEGLARERTASVGDDAPTDQIREALSIFDALGASWDAARCARVARRRGLGVPVPYRGGRRGYGDQLSPREAEVAALAATGATNKQIAAELHLSPTTVSKHLGRAMRKLGVRSRVQLAAQRGTADG